MGTLRLSSAAAGSLWLASSQGRRGLACLHLGSLLPSTPPTLRQGGGSQWAWSCPSISVTAGSLWDPSRSLVCHVVYLGPASRRLVGAPAKELPAERGQALPPPPSGGKQTHRQLAAHAVQGAWRLETSSSMPGRKQASHGGLGGLSLLLSSPRPDLDPCPMGHSHPKTQAPQESVLVWMQLEGLFTLAGGLACRALRVCHRDPAHTGRMLPVVWAIVVL